MAAANIPLPDKIRHPSDGRCRLWKVVVAAGRCSSVVSSLVGVHPVNEFDVSIYYYSPHLCVGFLFLILYPGLLLRLLLLRPPPHFVHTHFINKHFVQNTLSTHTLSTHTLSPHTLSTNTLSTHALSTYTLCPHTLCHHTLCPQTLCPQTLCPHTLYQHTLCHHNTHNTWHSWHWVARLDWLGRLWRRGTLRGRRGTNSHPPSFHVAGVAQTHIYRRFAWQAWHSWQWVARLDWLGRLWRRGTLRGRRGTNSHPPSFHVAGVAQTHIYRRFAWQAWHSWHWVARLDWLGRLWRRGTLRGRRGTTWHPPSFHVAGVAQTHIYLRFTWQAWHSWHWVARLDWLGRLWRRGTLRGRRGTTWHPPSFHVAGVAQTHIYLRFTWQAWHSWHWVARLDWLGRLWRRGTLRGRRGTNSHPPSFHVAGVAQTHIYLRFTWQAWHSWHWVARLDWLGRLWRRGTLRGRRGTTWHPPSFHVAGVAQTHIYLRFTWQAWHSWHWVARLDWLGRLWRRGTLRGRRGTTWHPPSFHVAGVAQTHIYLRFTWQAWHSWHWVARLDWLGRLWRRGTLRGRRGTTVWKRTVTAICMSLAVSALSMDSCFVAISAWSQLLILPARYWPHRVHGPRRHPHSHTHRHTHTHIHTHTHTHTHR